jgi:hypothetical protein
VSPQHVIPSLGSPKLRKFHQKPPSSMSTRPSSSIKRIPGNVGPRHRWHEAGRGLARIPSGWPKRGTRTTLASKPVRQMAKGIPDWVRPEQDPAPIFQCDRRAARQSESSSRGPPPDQIQEAWRFGGLRRRDDRPKLAKTAQKRRGRGAAADSHAKNRPCRVSPSPSANSAVDGMDAPQHGAREGRFRSRIEPVQTKAIVDRSCQLRVNGTEFRSDHSSGSARSPCWIRFHCSGVTSATNNV